MSLTALGLLAAFGAGVLSFLSPCVLPLVPGYLSYLAGASSEEAQSRPAARWQVSRNVLWFVLGCSLVLVTLGTGAALLGGALSAYQQGLERIGGLALILFGIALTGLVRVPWLSGDYRLSLKPGRSLWWRSGLTGVTFGACWSACSTPILASILVLTMVRSLLLVQGMFVMLAFAAGQAAPFLLVDILMDRAGPILHRVHRYTAPLSRLGGATHVLLGVFLLLGLVSGS